VTAADVRGDLRVATWCCGIRPFSRLPTASALTNPSTKPRYATWLSSAPVPAGLAAAVYGRIGRLGCSCTGDERGRRTGRLQPRRSKITLGFPTGISGQDPRGAGVYAGRRNSAPQDGYHEGGPNISRRDRRSRLRPLEIDDSLRVPARTIIIATGAAYRKPPIGNLSQFEGTGVYYAATFMERQMCRGEEMWLWWGGGNSAGQAGSLPRAGEQACAYARCDRAAGESMSRYLIRASNRIPAIVLSANTRNCGSGRELIISNE